MRKQVAALALFGLYQLTVTLGIALMPLAIAARWAGVELPVGRLVERVAAAYDSR